MDATSIIVPCYNEGNRLKPNDFKSYLKSNSFISFIFVNDGSTDNTGKIIQTISVDNFERVKILTNNKNLGKAQAVRSGVLKAINAGAKNIGYWDADLSTSLEIINKMVDKINENITFVIGSRVKMLGYQIERSLIRHYTGRFFATMASSFLDLPIYDTQCGAKIFKNNFEIEKAFSKPFSVNWSFDVELISRIKIIKKNFNLKPFEATAIEYPLEKWIHCEGSSVRAIDLFVAIKELLSLRKKFRSSTYVSNFI